jgi:hypothetical protein
MEWKQYFIHPSDNHSMIVLFHSYGNHEGWMESGQETSFPFGFQFPSQPLVVSLIVGFTTYLPTYVPTYLLLHNPNLLWGLTYYLTNHLHAFIHSHVHVMHFNFSPYNHCYQHTSTKQHKIL